MAVARKPKKKAIKIRRQKVNKVNRLKRPARRKIKVTLKPAAKNPAVLGQVIIEKAKFSYAQVPPAPRGDVPQELPAHYGISRMALLVRDPWWLYAWWEVVPEVYERLRAQLKEEFLKAKRILRVYDVTNVDFDGKNAAFFDIEINEWAENWYINAGPARSWCVDLGLLLADGRFITILRSNIVCTPLDGPSWITDEEWMIPEEMFARLYGMGLGSGRSSPSKGWQARLSWASLSSRMGSGSMSSPTRSKR